MSKFINEISIKTSSFEEYDELFKELVKLGYVATRYYKWDKQWCYLKINYLNENGIVGLDGDPTKGEVEQGNIELFLALAAMTDNPEGSIGEYWTCVVSAYNFTVGKSYLQIKKEVESINAFTTNSGSSSGMSGRNKEYFRKSTIQEIKNHFKQTNNMNTKVIGYKLKDQKYTKAVASIVGETVSFVTTNTVEINSRGYKALKEAEVLDLWFEEIKEEVPVYKVGDYVVITGNSNSHNFNIGQTVVISGLPEKEGCDYKGKDSVTFWFLNTKDFRLATREEINATKEVTYTMGTGNISIRIRNGVIVADGQKVNLKSLISTVGFFSEYSTKAYSWTVQFEGRIKFGCSFFNVEELQKIIDTAQSQLAA